MASRAAASTVDLFIQSFHSCVLCACVSACAFVCVRACVRVCVRSPSDVAFLHKNY